VDVALGRRCIAVLVLVILGWAAAAHAEDAVPPAPPGTRSLADTPFQLVLPEGRLFGDWAGTRTWLEEGGITPTVTLVMDALGNPTGGTQQGFRQASNLNVDLRFDLQKLFGLAPGSFEISFSERFGSSLSREDIGNVFTVQQVFRGQTYRLVDVAYQQQLFEDRVELRETSLSPSPGYVNLIHLKPSLTVRRTGVSRARALFSSTGPWSALTDRRVE
jgi:porin